MKKSQKIRSVLIVAAAIIIAITTLRFFFLPVWVGEHIQKKVKNIAEYETSYQDFEISVLSLSYSIKNILLIKKNSRLPLPFFQSERMIFQFDASSLLSDRWVSKVSVIHPVIHFINGPDEVSSQTRISSEWVHLIEDLATIPVDKMSIKNGEINYHDYHSVPKVLLHMNEIFLNGNNLCNRSGEETLFSGTVVGSGKVVDGSITVKMELNAFHEKPMFRLTAELLKLNLSDVRDFLKAYGNIEIQQGIFSLYTEAATKNNKVVGFIKPVIEDIAIASSGGTNNLELIRTSTEHKNNVWATTTNGTGSQNEIRFEGNMDEPGMNIWGAAAMTLHNAFVEALVNSLKKSVRLPNTPAPIVKPKFPASTTASKLDSQKKESLFKRIFKRKDEKRKK